MRGFTTPTAWNYLAHHYRWDEVSWPNRKVEAKLSDLFGTVFRNSAWTGDEVVTRYLKPDVGCTREIEDDPSPRWCPTSQNRLAQAAFMGVPKFDLSVNHRN
jgi:hypothetical protein